MIINQRFTVHRVVEGLMKKLDITESIYDIIKAHQKREVSLPPIPDVSLEIVSEANSESTLIPETDLEVFYPWKDVLASMYMYPDKVRLAKTTCPICGKNLIRLHFSSPSWTWKALCGRAGTMMICPSCPKQVDFCLETMN